MIEYRIELKKTIRVSVEAESREEAEALAASRSAEDWYGSEWLHAAEEVAA